MSTFNYALTILTFCLLLLVAGCGPDPSDASKPSEPESAPEKATSVVVQPVSATDLEEHITLPGSLEPWENLTLAAEIAGPVDWVGPEEGERVRTGQKILTIDSVSQKANLESARVDAEVKETTMKRYASLVKESLVSRQVYDNSVTAYEAAKQNYELSRIALGKSNVSSPIDGVLDMRHVERGEYIKVGNPVAVIVQVDRLKAMVDVPEKDVRYFHVGEEVDIIQAQIDTGEEIYRDGKLVHLTYNADPLTRTYRAKVEVDNSDGQLRPGMIIRMKALRRNLKDVIAIPLYALVDLDGRKVAYVVEANRARMRPVEIDRVIGKLAVIKSGLSLDEPLVVKGQQLLTDGVQVKVEDN